MKTSWIQEQTGLNVAQFDKAMETHYPESRAYVHDPQEHIKRICVECNYLDAAKLVDWQRYLPGESVIMDMGCGGGWLTGYLSGFEAVRTIYALDSSKHYLEDLMPRVVDLMQGRQEKVVPVEGFFTPLLLKEGSLDAIVASSALHHAENLEGVLKEARRTLKKDGLLFVLNEVPFSWLGYIALVARSTSRIFARLVFRMYKPISQSVSAAGFLDNPLLGDRIYPLWYWKEAIQRAGFSLIERVDTGLTPVKNSSGHTLVHFVCKAV